MMGAYMAQRHRIFWVMIFILTAITTYFVLNNNTASFAQSGDARQLTPDMLTSGTIDTPDNVDEWFFDGVGNRLIEITIAPTADSVLIPLITLFDTSQTELTSIEGTPAATLTYQLPATSTYFVRVSGDDGTSGSYQILLTITAPDAPDQSTPSPPVNATSTLIPPTPPNNPPPTFIPAPPQVGNPISLGQTVEGTVDDGRWAVWQFEGTSGQRITIRLRSSQFDPFLELYSPMSPRLPLYIDDDSGRGRNATLFNILLPDNGTYRIYVRSFEDNGAGAYRLSLEPDSGLPVTVETSQPIHYGDQITANLQDEEVTYYFDASAGDTITILLNSADFDTYVELLAADNTLLEDNDDNGRDRNSVIRHFQLPADGTYFILVTSFNYDATGNFTLELLDMTTNSVSTGGEITIGQTTIGRLLPDTTADWTFKGDAGQTISAAAAPLQPDERYDLVLELIDPNGNSLFSDDEGGYRRNPAIIDFRLPTEGTYTLRISEFNITVGGPYRLSLATGRTYFSPLNEPARLVPHQPEPPIFLTDTLDDADNAYRLWLVDVPPNQPLSLSIVTGNGAAGFPQDFEIFILDTQWEPVAESRTGDVFIDSVPDPTDYLILLHYRGTGTQTYQLHVNFAPTNNNRPPVPILGELQLDMPQSGMLHAGERHAWRFIAPENGVYSFTVIRHADETPAYDPYLVVMDESGERIAEDDDSAGGLNPRVTLELIAGQQIMLHVTSFADTSDGSYEVSVTQE